MSDARPTELVIEAKPAPGDANDGGGTAMAPFLLPVVAFGALSKLVSITAGLVGLALSIALLIAIRKPNAGHFVLRIDDGLTLDITRSRDRTFSVRLPLADVLDVTLERKTRAGARGGASIERVRIALDRASPLEPIFVPEDPITSIEGQEWQARVRVFLRKHGWLPKDERGDET